MASSTPDGLELKDSSILQTGTSHDEFHEEVDPVVERKLKWKLDLFILPLISSVYFFAAMGRSDLGNAKVAGLSDELRLSPTDYSNAATMFLVGYVVLQLPGTLLIKKIRAPIQFSGAMMLWGLFSALTVTIKNTGQLLALRFLVGAAEAFVQGGVFYLSFWYRYTELATRGAIFFSMSTIAGAFNGLISYGISKDLEGVNGWRAWRWIFLIEGIMPVAFSFVVLVLLPVSPTSVRFGFNATEKELLVRRSQEAHNSSEARLEVKKVHRVLFSIHFWLFVLIACCSHFATTSLFNFLPDIVKGFGYTSINAQLFTVIVYAFACAGVLFWARVADRTNARGLAIALSTAGGVVGYALLIGIKNNTGRFVATCLVAFSMYPNTVLLLSWSAMSFVGYTRRGSALAFINIFSQLFSISGQHAYIDPPDYRIGHASALALSVVILVSSLVLRWYFSYLNAKKKEAQFSERATMERQKSIEELGDLHPDFFYTT